MAISRRSLCAVPILFTAAATTGAFAQVAGKDVPYVPTPLAAVDKMLRMANTGPQDIVWDLGSGDGRIVVMAAQRFGVRRAVGVDIDPQRIVESMRAARQAGVSERTEFQQKNLRDADFREATVLTMYLLPQVNLELRPRILSQLKPGTRIVSHQFTMGDWIPDETAEVEGRRLYRWIVPAQADGAWRWTMGGETFRLNLGQKYQNVGGNLQAYGTTVPVRTATLTGDRLSFETMFRRDGLNVPARFNGTVNGSTLDGTFQAGEKTARITASRAD